MSTPLDDFTFAVLEEELSFSSSNFDGETFLFVGLVTPFEITSSSDFDGNAEDENRKRIKCY